MLGSGAPDSVCVCDFDPIAEIYDYLVWWAPYDSWVDLIEKRLTRYGLDRNWLILDVACGTGLSTIPWAEKGYGVVGVDCSAPMLRQARKKAEGKDWSAEFVQQDLLILDLPQRFDVAICMHSGLDYIMDERDLLRAFRSVRSSLRQGGLFAFDKCLDEPDFYCASYSTSMKVPAGTAVIHYSWNRRRKLLKQHCVVIMEAEDEHPRRIEITHRLRATSVRRLTAIAQETGFQMVEPPTKFWVQDPGMAILRAV